MSEDPSATDRTRAKARRWGAVVGPGLLVAATGVGAGDLVAAAVSGSRFGLAVAWAAVVGAALKFTVNEGLARWQLATGTTLIEGWARHLGRTVQVVFLLYLVLWSFVVAAALISACGLAAHALAPGLSVEVWGALHSVAAAVLVLFGGYARFERLVGLFVGVMFVTLVGTALVVDSPVRTIGSLVASAGVPAGSGRYLLGVIGGVGGSVTLLCYGYWIRERGWSGPEHLRTVRVDLAVAYVLTGAFGLAVLVLAAKVLHTGAVEIAGARGVVRMAAMLGDVIGPAGHWIFLVGVWGAMATSMLGVWQGVPYLFDDFVGLLRSRGPTGPRRPPDTRSAWYRGFLLFLAVPPMTMLVLGRPVRLIVVYAVTSALFMPFLAATLLYMNSRTDWVGPGARSGRLANGALVLCLLLFGYLAWQDILGAIRT